MSAPVIIGHVAFFDFTAVDRRLRDVEDRGRNLAAAFRKLRPPMRKDQTEHDKRAEGSDGKWQPRAESTEERRRRINRGRRRRAGTNKALKTIGLAPIKKSTRPMAKKLLGRLPKAIRITSGSLWIRATSFAPFGGSHNSGADVGRRRRSHLPKREFLWLSDQLLARAAQVFEEHLLERWKQ